MEQNNKFPPLSMFVGNVIHKDQTFRYILHAEAIIAMPPQYRVLENGRAVLRLRCGLSRNPWSIFGPEKVEEKASDPSANANFIDIVVFNEMATKLKDTLACRGKIAFCGLPKEHTFVRNDGTPGSSVSVIADGVYPLSSKAHAAGVPLPQVVVRTRINKKGNQVQTVCLLAGKVVEADNAIVQRNGYSHYRCKLELPMPVGQLYNLVQGGPGGEYGTCLYCEATQRNVKGAPKTMAPGNVLVVSGEMAANTYNGNTYFSVRADELSVMAWANSGQAPAQHIPPANEAASQRPQQSNYTWMGGAEEVTPQPPVGSDPAMAGESLMGSFEYDYEGIMDGLDDGELPF